MSPKVVVFDIGRVLIDYDPIAFYDAEIGEARRKALFQAVDLEAYNLRVDAGDPLVATFEEAVVEAPEFAAEIRMWSHRWPELVPGEISGTVEIFRKLKTQGTPVLALSNFGAETFEMAQARFEFLNWFDEAYVSAHLKAIKPDAAIYEALEQGSGYRGSDLLFVDDKVENIRAAQARGWHGHVFTSPEGWASCLADHGLLEAARQ